MLPIIQAIVTSLIANKLPKVAEAVVDKGIDFVEGKLGVKLEPDMTPEQIAAVKAAADRHEEFRIEQDNKNTADARDMQKVALQQDDVFSKRFIYWFSVVWSLFCATYITMITFMNIPESNLRFADTIIGFMLGTLIASMFNYFYGSSSGSTRKNAMLEEMLKKIKSKDEDETV